MVDYGIGDVVVCVDDAPRADDDPSLAAHWPISCGSIHRIIVMEDDLLRGIGVNLDCDPPEMLRRWLWHANRFRKVLKADDQFAEQMRALKPRVREREDA